MVANPEVEEQEVVKLTIAEALAEVKTLVKRIQKKEVFILNNIVRENAIKDAYEADGGIIEVMKREQQSLADLRQRLVNIKLAIQDVNRKTNVTVEGITKTIAEWIIWKREISGAYLAFNEKILNGIQMAKNESKMRDVELTIGVEGKNIQGRTLNINDKEIADVLDTYEKVVGHLDGKLSVVNATHYIEL